MTANAKPAYSPPGECAAYVRLALEAGGLLIKVPTKRYGDATGASACDYGNSLEAVGFKTVFDNNNLMCSKVTFKPIAGDVAIFDAFEGHRHGHIQMFNGVQWISDFLQKNIYPDQAPGLYPGGSYRKPEIPFKIYRNESMQIINYTPLNKLPWQ
ncbi:hypothetical protein EYF70_10795 [Pseudoduganella albidiflava]|uniref:CHAP domain-containing protein n=1 Tax=Pseudoduganella albidiflava TaxID=321983 RepID=A0ABX5S1X5_9BURK|nr:hypothetical protein EYF70_10795 [Pseudoduganella albidiflava]